MTPKEKEGTVKEWPVLQVRKDEFKGAVAGYIADDRFTTGGSSSTTYYPASHPAVLSAEECWLLDRYSTGNGWEDAVEESLEKLLDRLSTYAEENR